MSEIKLPSGKNLYTNNEILGINDAYEMYEGYDGEIDKKELSVDDIIYLADLAIGRWSVVKNEALRNKPQELLECTDRGNISTNNERITNA